MIGPLGRPFEVDSRSRHLLLMAEGAAIASVRLLVDEAIRDGRSVTLLFGARVVRARSTRRACCPTRSSTSSPRPTGASGTAGPCWTSCSTTRPGPTRRSRPGRRRCSARSRAWPSGRRGRMGVATLGASAAAGGRPRPAPRRRGARRSSRSLVQAAFGCAAGTCLGCVVAGVGRPGPGVPRGPGVRGRRARVGRRREGEAARADGEDGAWHQRPRRTPTVRRIKPAITPAEAEGRRAAGSRRPWPDRVDRSPQARPSTRSAVARSRSRSTSGRGLVLDNPVIVASGPFGYGVEVADAVDLARLGGIVTRSTTLKPRSGHPAPRMADVPAGVLLGMGLQNPGIDAVLERYAHDLGEVAGAGDREPGRRVGVGRRGRGAPPRGCPGRGRHRAQPVVRPTGPAAGHRSGSTRRRRVAGAGRPPRHRPPAHRQAHRGRARTCARSPGPWRTPARTPSRRSTRCPASPSAPTAPAPRSAAATAACRARASPDRPARRVRGRPGRSTSRSSASAGSRRSTTSSTSSPSAPSAVGVGIAALADPMLPVRLADELADACRARGLTTIDALIGTALPKRASPPSTPRRRVRPLMPTILLWWLVAINVVTADRLRLRQEGGARAAAGGSASGRCGSCA